MAKLPYNRIGYVEIGGGGTFDEMIASGFKNVRWERLKGLDLKFDITHPIGSAESEANISICGLSFKRIMQLMSWAGEATAYSRCWMIRVFAGYGETDDDVDMIFEGVMINAMPTMPPDVWLNIYARSHYSNRYQYFTADIDTVLGGGKRMMPVGEALRTLCKLLKASDNIDEDNDIDATVLEDTQVALPEFAREATYHDIESAISKICKQNNMVYVKRIMPDLKTKFQFAPYLYEDGKRPTAIYTISSDNGMVGIPKMRYDGIEVTSLLSNTEHDLRLDIFSVRSRFSMPGMFGSKNAAEENRIGDEGVFECSYRCISIRYHGHLRGDEWFVTYNGNRFITVGDKPKPSGNVTTEM